MEQDDALDFKLKVLQDNSKMFFDNYKRLEYQAYINITLSTFLLTAVFAIINKEDYHQGNAKVEAAIILILLILFVITSSIIYFSFLTLRKSTITDFINYKFINFLNINDSLLLKESLLAEMGEKIKGLIETYIQKDKYLDYSTNLLFAELGIILGMMATVIYFILMTT